MAHKKLQLQLGAKIAEATTDNDFDLAVDVEDILDTPFSLLRDVILDLARQEKLNSDIHFASDTAESHTVAHVSLMNGKGWLPWEERPAIIIVRISDEDSIFADTALVCLADIRRAAFIGTIESTLSRHSIELVDVEAYVAQVGTLWGVNFLFSHRTSIGQLFQIRHELAYAAFFPQELTRNARMILEMLRSGMADKLLGIQESHFFEAKAWAYERTATNAKDHAWKVELAQHVAKFANSDGGLLVIGAITKRIHGIDTITKLAPIPSDPRRIHSYGQILDTRIHPPISLIEIESIPADGGELLCILVPPQPEESKPFLVQGGLIEGDFDAGVISIVRRRGEASIPVTVREIHAMLAAGRALLRGKQRLDYPATGDGGQIGEPE